jgi:hypothetical protein
MRRARIARLIAGIAVVVGAAAACGDKVCAGQGVDLHTPADTTVALHQSIVLAAGSAGTCGGPTSPISADALTQWQAGDSSIVSVAALDSLHARINGLALGTTSVMASWQGFVGSTIRVTVR